MSGIRRIKNIIMGLVMLACSILMVIVPEDGYKTVVFILDISLLLYGFRMLVYYFSMARFMTGGIMTLYKSIIAIDFGLFVFFLDEIPEKFVMIYLIVITLFNGLLIILGAVDARRLEASFWKHKLVYGIVKIMMGLACIVMFGSEEMIAVVYSLGLIHSAFYNITTAFRKTAIIHIE